MNQDHFRYLDAVASDSEDAQSVPGPAPCSTTCPAPPS